MRSLFFKIFLWFWLASILIIGSTLVLVSLLEPYQPLREDGRHVRRSARFGRMAVDILERQGPHALQEFINRRGHRPGRHVFLFDENSEPVTDRNPPLHVKELARQARESGATEFQRRNRSVLLAQTVYGPGGSYYIMVSEMPRRPQRSLASRFLNPRFLSVRLLAIFIIASFFCYWLAWYLTSPVRKLRTATQELASGDLKTRVGLHLGSRRDELSDLGRDFDLMAERMESLVTSQSRLLRDISHELRSPLARLNVALELARQRSGSEAAEFLDRIERESERLNYLIGQLRTLTLLESGADNIDRKPLDLSRLVKAVSIDADFEAASANRSVKTELDENITVDGSEELLRRAMENVVRNAVRYTDEGTAVEISLQRRPLQGSEWAVLTVRDHGPGVPEEVLGSLTIPFYRIAESRDRRTGGMGIGLAITDRSVQLHGGTVKAANHPEGGLVIEITLPLFTGGRSPLSVSRA
jgi:two-component system sensor histidine kinase CpxA